MGAPNHVQHGFFDIALEDRLSFHATRRATERGIDLVWVALVLRHGRAIRHLDTWRISLVGLRRPPHVAVELWSLADGKRRMLQPKLPAMLPSPGYNAR